MPCVGHDRPPPPVAWYPHQCAGIQHLPAAIARPFAGRCHVRRNLARRAQRSIEISGIRKVFELGKSLKDPINLSIGQPHFDVPAPIKAAAKAAIDAGHNGYVVTQGIPELRERLLADVKARFPGQDRDVVVTSGTSGGLLLALLAAVNPGEEVVSPDPYFVSYPHMVTIAGGTFVPVDTYPTFRLDPDRVKAALTPRTKAIMLSTPSNPTGAVVDAESQKAIAELARQRGILLISDEIYRASRTSPPACGEGRGEGGSRRPLTPTLCPEAGERRKAPWPAPAM